MTNENWDIIDHVREINNLEDLILKIGLQIEEEENTFPELSKNSCDNIVTIIGVGVHTDFIKNLVPMLNY